MSTIPASDFVRVNPGVLAAGGSALDLNGMLLSTSSRVPVASVLSFKSPAAVAAFFGSSSGEVSFANVYFAGFDDSNVKPGELLITQYPTAAVAAYLRGGNVALTTLPNLQAISGNLSVTIDAVVKSGAINLSGATSFSNAAALIGKQMAISGPPAAVVTGAISGTTLTVSAVTSGILAVGQVLSGSGLTPTTYITALGTGTGGAGTYTVSDSQTFASGTINAAQPGVTYDSVSGAFVVVSPTTGPTSTITYGSSAVAPALKLTSGTGAVLSQGSAAATPSAFMSALVLQAQNWAAFTTSFDPDQGSGNAQKYAFATWASQQNARYAYVAHDNDASPTVQNPAPTSLGQLLIAGGISGTVPIYQPSNLYGAAFVLGAIASIDFSQPEGRTTLAYRRQAGLVPGVTDQQAAANLVANGYNYYGAIATANDQFNWFYPGSISGPFKWIDTFVNQIWLNNQLQLDLVKLLVAARSIPYNSSGRSQVEAAVLDTIEQALSFGVCRAGVVLSSLQKSQVNTAAGKDIASTLQNRGWYLQVGEASPTVQQNRGSPPIAFWYVDGESIQKITLSSIVLQ